MAEFQEVIKQVVRMCKSFGASCDACKLNSVDGVAKCQFYSLPDTWNVSEMRDVEQIIMQWAAEHPEPVYPSWREWQKANFPNALHDICPNYFMPKKPLGTCAVSCKKCINTPIPADIAKKLGIKPMEVRRDA